MTRARLLQGAIVVALAGSFGVALLRGDNVTQRLPSKEEWRLRTMGEPPREPTSLTEFLGVGAHLPVPRTVAIVRVGPLTEERAEVTMPRPGPTITSPAGVRITPPPLTQQGPTTDYAVRIEEVISPSDLRVGDTITLRYGARPTPGTITPYPHPIEGQRLLLVLVPDIREPASGAFVPYAYGTADVTGTTAHLVDAWRTPVSVMGVPAATTNFIEAVRAATRAP